MTAPMSRQPASLHHERHRSGRAGWLRAAVLGANDAIVSTASLMIGVASASSSKEAVVVAGGAGLIAGAMSMAAGEFVSVSTQRDSEKADIAKETHELEHEPEAELQELAAIYRRRGLDADLALQVATQLTAKDGLAAHLRDELGVEPGEMARPIQAAWISAVSFAVFAAIPLATLLVAPEPVRIPAIAAVSLASLTALGAWAAHLGGAPQLHAALRVLVGGGIAMAVTAAIGHLLGVAA